MQAMGGEAAPGAAEDLLEEVDVEEHSKTGQAVPRAHRYRIRIDRDTKVVNVPRMKGREILELVGKTPETHILRQKFRGGEVKKVAADEVVDFTRPGVERFTTMAIDQTDG